MEVAICWKTIGVLMDGNVREMREKQEEVLKTERSVWEGRCVGRQRALRM